MYNNTEVEKLIAILNNVNMSLSKNRTEISGIKLNISKIKSDILELKRVYPDLCELEQLDVSIESQNNLLEQELDAETKEIFEGKIRAFQARKKEIFKKLDSIGIRSKEEYEEKMATLDDKKELMSDLEAKVNKKEQENLELIQRKVTLEKKIEELSKEEIKAEDASRVKKRDLTQSKKSANTSELAAFLGYEEEEEEEEPKPVVEKPKKVKKAHKKEEIDDIINKIIKKQRNISDKFDEIMQESNDDDIKTVMGKLKKKFEDEISKEVQIVTYSFLRKKMEILELEEQLPSYTPEIHEKNLEDLRETLISRIQEIDNSQQKLEGEVKYNFNEFKEHAISDLNYLQTLRERILEQTNQIDEKITNIEEQLGYLLANSKESLLEQMKKLENLLNDEREKERDLEEKSKEDVVQILDILKDNIRETESYEDFMRTLDEVKERITQEETRISEEKNKIDLSISELETQKNEVEEKYNNKTDDKEEEAMLLDSKQALKDESVQVIDMVNVLTNRQQEFVDTVRKKKQEIKSDIKQKDNEIVTRKTELLKEAQTRIKTLPVLLKESIDIYNKKHIGEFNLLMNKISSNIDNIEHANDGYKVMTNNVVVLSEFDENTQLLKELKELIQQGVDFNKSIVNTVQIDTNREKSTIEQDVEQNISTINVLDTISSKIPIEEIVEIEDGIGDVEQVKQGVNNICTRLNIEEEINEPEIEEPTVNEEVKPEVEEPAVNEETEQEVGLVVDEEPEPEKVVVEQIIVPQTRRSTTFGLEDYSEEEQAVLKEISWEQLVELKNLNRAYNKVMYIDDLKELQQEKVEKIANLKQEYKEAVEQAKKLYEIKKYVISYKKGMEELANGAKSQDSEDQKEYNKLMKNATKSLKKMKENGISSFEDFRYKVMKNSETVKQILANTKSENEELVKITGLIQAIEKPNELEKTKEMDKVR